MQLHRSAHILQLNVILCIKTLYLLEIGIMEAIYGIYLNRSQVQHWYIETYLLHSKRSLSTRLALLLSKANPLHIELTLCVIY